jgi:hypothetical protein
VSLTSLPRKAYSSEWDMKELVVVTAERLCTLVDTIDVRTTVILIAWMTRAQKATNVWGRGHCQLCRMIHRNTKPMFCVLCGGSINVYESNTLNDTTIQRQSFSFSQQHLEMGVKTETVPTSQHPPRQP